jgi:ketosteroid isomerase-like protein
VLVVLLCLGGGYLYQHPELTGKLLDRIKLLIHPAEAPEELAPGDAAEPALAAQPVPAQAPKAMSKDVRVWVEDWAAAMRTRDPQAMVPFYADPIDRYFLDSRVKRKQMLESKRLEMGDPSVVWTFEAEHVTIDRQTATNAVVLLTKHIIVKTPSSPMRDEYLKTQLKLRMTEDGWKIYSERTLG